jgi:hypothetical protein
MKLAEIDYKAIQFFRKNPLVVLRSSYSDIALNVSYSFKGLKWSCDRNGRSLYFKNGIIRNGEIQSTDGGALIPRKDVYVQRFIPINHDSIILQAAEFAAVKRGYKLLYSIPEPYVSKKDVGINNLNTK